MQVYEAGAYVAESLKHDSPKLPKTYVFTLENPYDYTLDEIVEKTKDYLGELIDSYDATKLEFTTKLGEKFMIGHDVVLTKTGTLEYFPCPIFRHAMSRLYTFESLYIAPATKEVVDFSRKGICAVHDKTLEPLHGNYKEIVTANPNLLLYVLDILLTKRMNLSRTMWDILKTFDSTKPISNTIELERILKQGNQFSNIATLQQVGGLFDYLVDCCGLNYDIKIVTPAKPYKQKIKKITKCYDILGPAEKEPDPYPED
jgi:hypothetical protein